MKNWLKSGAPWIWLNGGAVAISVIMVVGLIGLIAIRGFGHFWPAEIASVQIIDEQGQSQQVLGQIVRSQNVPARVLADSGAVFPVGFDIESELVERFLIKQGNRDVTGRDFVWHSETGMDVFTYPENAMMLERREWGDFYGFPLRVLENGEVVGEGDNLWPELQARVARSVSLFNQIRSLEKGAIGDINFQLERLRLDERRLNLRADRYTATQIAEEEARIASVRESLDQEYAEVAQERSALLGEIGRDSLIARVADGREITIPLRNIVRATQPNDMSVFAKLGEYAYRFWDFISGEPREANTEGGIFPAIFGTVVMVLLMSIIVTPFGVLAAIYLREYAKQGPVLKIIRISVYNLAGVPSIVYGVFGLGFFVYILGGNIDSLFYPEAAPAPVFGTPGLFWASLTLALLTLPVVIVSTEEGLARIPSTIRQGSLALGATKSETLWKVVVPLSTPAMMTGLILAVARAAGEVAPLMLVGVVKLAPTLPVDGNFPFVHLERKIMHLGFHIYDVGFQSPNVEAAQPLVYATALTLVILIVALNLTAISIRNRLRERYRSESD